MVLGKSNELYHQWKKNFEKMAHLCSSIYTAGTFDIADTNYDDAELLSVADLLKKNRVLYHILKILKENEYSLRNPRLVDFIKKGDDHYACMNRSLNELNALLGCDNFMVFKTYYYYRRLTADVDILVRDLESALQKLCKYGWTPGQIQQGTVDLRKGGYLTIGLHQIISWDTPPLFDHALLWQNLRERNLAGVNVIIPSPEVDILSILAHIPFEKLYMDWGEMCYLYRTANEADLDMVFYQASRHHWGLTLQKLLTIFNNYYHAAFGIASPFESICSKRVPIIRPILPYECSFMFAGLSLIEIRAWKKILGVLSDSKRISHFFKGRSERKMIRA